MVAPVAPEVIDACVAATLEPARSRFAALVALVRSEVPEGTVETMAWGMPTWHRGENLLSLKAWAQHVGVYPGAAAIEAFAVDLAGLPVSKGTIQVRHDQPVPDALLRRLVRWRVARAEETLKKRTKASPRPT